MKVLVIDDEADVRLIIRLGLERVGGMKVIEASAGIEGVAAAQAEMPDAILLDVMLPGMDGAAVLQALHRQPGTASIPVVILTASVRPEKLPHLREPGVAGFIAKPFDPMTLAMQVKNLLKPRTHSGLFQKATDS